MVLSQDQDVVKFNCTKAISTDTHKLVRAMYQQDVQNNFDMNVSPCYMDKENALLCTDKCMSFD